MKVNVMVKPLFRLMFVLFCILVALPSCSNEEDLNFDAIDDELLPHFQKFEEEAGKRGLNIQIENEGITAEIANIASPNVAGQCSTGGEDEGSIIIDRPFWERSDYLTREMLVFHELGHCVLSRPHDDSRNGMGHCNSIMASGTSTCTLEYTAETRDGYLDELFE